MESSELKYLIKNQRLLKKNMVSFAKLPRIRQGIGKKYKNIGLENFLLSILLNSVMQIRVMN
jgi:hypothetical protein